MVGTLGICGEEHMIGSDIGIREKGGEEDIEREKRETGEERTHIIQHIQHYNYRVTQWLI